MRLFKISPGSEAPDVSRRRANTFERDTAGVSVRSIACAHDKRAAKENKRSSPLWSAVLVSANHFRRTRCNDQSNFVTLRLPHNVHGLLAARRLMILMPNAIVPIRNFPYPKRGGRTYARSGARNRAGSLIAPAVRRKGNRCSRYRFVMAPATIPIPRK